MMAEFNSEYQLMDPIDFHSMFLIAVVNCLFPTIFKISSFVFNRRKKLLQICNMRGE